MAESIRERLPDLRRDFHRYPEPAWCEFHTTGRLVEELRTIGVDELAIGPEAYDPADRMAVPSDERLADWKERARERGVDPDLLDRMDGGNTGVVAVLDRGEGPTVGLRVDIDGLFIDESDGERTPAGHRGVSVGNRRDDARLRARRPYDLGARDARSGG